MVTLSKSDSRAGSKPTATVSVSNTNMTPEERFLCHKAELHQRLIKGMDLSAIAQLSEEELRLEVRHAAQELCRHSSDLLTMGQQERLVNEVINETFGLGPLEGLFADPTISDILINGPKTVYVERQGRLEQSPVVFNDNRHLVQIVLEPPDQRQHFAGIVAHRDPKCCDACRAASEAPQGAIDLCTAWARAQVSSQ